MNMMFPKPEKKQKKRSYAKPKKTKQPDDGLMFPKYQKKTKRKQHKKSILQPKDGRCYLCMILENNYQIYRMTHKHHIYGGPLRDISEAEGFTVDLCIPHHEFAKKAVHNNYENMRLLKRHCQMKYEETHSRQQFMELIGRNYLEENDV